MPRERPKLGCGDRGQACHRLVRRLPRHILTDLLKATKLSRGSFYAAWGAFLRALDGYIDDSLVRLDAEIDAPITALEGLRGFLAGMRIARQTQMLDGGNGHVIRSSGY
jgi:hypothetical protein